jgi:hypothetical protein
MMWIKKMGLSRRTRISLLIGILITFHKGLHT